MRECGGKAGSCLLLAASRRRRSNSFLVCVVARVGESMRVTQLRAYRCVAQALVKHCAKHESKNAVHTELAEYDYIYTYDSIHGISAHLGSFRLSTRPHAI